jgi:glyoxylase-like metal-dependent hydrolase (beta-lactamase superfamily II)
MIRLPEGSDQMSGNTLRVGNVEILALTDARTKGPCNALFPDLGREDWEPFAEQLLDDCASLPVAITSYVVRSQGKTVLVDTGIGAKERPFFPVGRLPDAMADAGVAPESIDIVMTTHMHIDHVGWHTTQVGESFVPTFPKARHVFQRDEYAYFTSPEVVDLPENQHIRDCVLPLDGHAEIDLVDGEHKLTDELTLLPTPGHTPAHVSIAILSGGEAGVIIGDVCHHPAQVTNAGWSPIFDMNPALAKESRDNLMRRIAEERMLCIAGHFPSPGFGRVVQVDGRRTWRAM